MKKNLISLLLALLSPVCLACSWTDCVYEVRGPVGLAQKVVEAFTKNDVEAFTNLIRNGSGYEVRGKEWAQYLHQNVSIPNVQSLKYEAEDLGADKCFGEAERLNYIYSIKVKRADQSLALTLFASCTDEKEWGPQDRLVKTGEVRCKLSAIDPQNNKTSSILQSLCIRKK